MPHSFLLFLFGLLLRCFKRFLIGRLLIGETLALGSLLFFNHHDIRESLNVFKHIP